MGKLGNHLDGGDGRHPPAGPETGDNALARDLRGGNAVDQELGELRGQDAGGQVGQAQHANQVDREDTGAHNGNDLGFLVSGLGGRFSSARPQTGHWPRLRTHRFVPPQEADARDTDDGVRDHYGAGASAFPSQGGGFLDEEDDSGDDTFDADGQEERGEGPTYVAGADGAQEQDAGPGDGGAGGGHGDSSSSSSSSSESGGAERPYRSYGFGRAYRHGGASSSSQEEESYDFQDEGMQGDDPSVFDGPGSSYRMRHAGPRALGNSWESARGAGSPRWEEGDSRSPEVQEGDSGEDSPSLERGTAGPPRCGRSTDEQQSEEEPRETPEVVRTLNEHSNSQTWEGQEDWDSAEDRSVLSTPDSESREEEEDTAEDTSAESPESPEGDSSPEDNTGEDSRSAESDNSESQEDGAAESRSREDGSPESSSHGDDSSLQSLESEGRRRRPGALRHRPAADYDDNDCQDGY
uniref:Dentin matrix acidic phosphoprotein 1 n=1 Tax=Ficedula albicollis TaxID=59894 RepID=A0A803W7G9_FICAL